MRNDTERIILTSSESESCECVSSADIEVWNSTYETVSSYSGDWTSADSAWKESADYWNSTYDTVSYYSADWNSAYSIASGIDVELYNSVIDLVSGSSSFLNSYLGESAIQVDSNYLSGIGSSGDPITFSESFKEDLATINSVFQQLYSGGQVANSAYKNWIEQDSIDAIYEILSKYQDYFWEVNNEFPESVDDVTGYIATDGIFHQLTNLWLRVSAIESRIRADDTTKLVYVEDLAPSAASNYSDDSTIYVSF